MFVAPCFPVFFFFMFLLLFLLIFLKKEIFLFCGQLCNNYIKKMAVDGGKFMMEAGEEEFLY